MNFKSAIATLILLIFNINTAFAHFTPACLQDSTVEYKWNGSNWYDSKKTYYTYDSLGNILSEEINGFNESTLIWEKVILIQNSYNPFSKLTQTITNQWDENNNQWKYNQKNTFEYIADTFLTIETNYFYDNGWMPYSKTEYITPDDSSNEITYHYIWKGSWVPLDKSEAYFYPNGLKYSYEYYKYDTILSDWVGQNKQTISYNNLNFIDSITNYEWISNKWAKYSLYTYQYNADSLEIISTTFNFISNNWVNFNKNEKKYQNKLTTQNLQFKWNGTTWDSTFNYTYKYDGNGNITESEIYSYNIMLNNWLGLSKSVRQYNSSNFIIETKNLKWNNTLKIWEEGTIKFNYEYNAINTLSALLRSNWNSSTNSWLYSSKRMYLFNEQFNQTSYIEQIYDSNLNTWIFISKDSSHYDSFFNETGESSYLWNNISNEWLPKNKITKHLFTFSISDNNKIQICPNEEIVLTTRKQSNATYNWYKNNTLNLSQLGTYKNIAKPNSTYNLIVKDKYCTYSSNNVQLIELPLPDVPIISNSNNILSISTNEPYITWFFENTAILDSNLTELFVSKSGKYTVEVNNNNKCSSISDEYNFNDKFLLIANNPTQTSVNIYFNFASSNIQIYNLNAQFITEINNVKSGDAIDFSTFTKGIYFLKIKNENGGFETKKIIKY